MQINKYFLFALALAIFFLGLYGSKLITRSDSQSFVDNEEGPIKSIPSQFPDERVNRLETAISNLSTQIEALMGRQNKTDEMLQASLQYGEDSVVDEQEKLSPEEQNIRFERARADQKTKFDERLTLRTIADQPWVLETESNLMSALESTLDPSFSGAASALCSDTLCRVDYRIPKDLDEDQKTNIDWTLAVGLGKFMHHSTRYSETSSNGDVVYSYYLARNGYDFSGVPRATESERDGQR